MCVCVCVGGGGGGGVVGFKFTKAPNYLNAGFYVNCNRC